MVCTTIYGNILPDYEWYSYNGHRYTLTMEHSNWLDAEAEAVAIGGHLVTVNTEAERDWLVDPNENPFGDQYLSDWQISRDPWKNGVWIGLEYVSGDINSPFSWQWVNGEPITFWEVQPSFYSFNGVHMLMTGGNHPIGIGQFTNDGRCDTDPGWYMRGIIEYELVPTQNGAVKRWEIEEGGNGNVYQFVETETKVTWLEAKELAESYGGHLVSVTSIEEHEFLLQNILNPSSGISILIGLYKNANGNWVWITGEDFTFQYWRPSEPNGRINEDYACYTMFDYTYAGFSDLFNDDSSNPRAFVVEYEMVNKMYLQADVNHDHIVNLFDFQIMAEQWLEETE